VTRSIEALRAGDYDAVLFTSAPGAAAWVTAVKEAGADTEVGDRVARGRLLLAAVGPVTAEPLAYAGFVAHRPARSRMGALARLVITELGNDRHALHTPHGVLRIRAAAATLDHRVVPLSRGGFAVLRRLADTPGHVVSREELLAILPGDSCDPHTAEVAVARLRESLREAGGDPRLVRTVIKRGYLLAAS
jgi:uroporphyrinogen-III synthase